MTQPKSRRTARTVLIIIACVVGLCCVGGSVAGYLFYRTIKSTTQPVTDATNLFMAHLEQGDIADAYAELCTLVRTAYTEEQFARLVDRRKPRSHSLSGVSVSTVNGRTTATTTGDITYVDNAVERHVFVLTKEGNDWQICGSPY